MKAHRFKTKLTTKEEVESEFFKELSLKISEWENSNVPIGCGVIKRVEFLNSKEGIMAKAGIKLDLIKEWERKGRNMAFLKNNREFNYMTLLDQKFFGEVRFV